MQHPIETLREEWVKNDPSDCMILVHAWPSYRRRAIAKSRAACAKAIARTHERRSPLAAARTIMRAEQADKNAAKRFCRTMGVKWGAVLKQVKRIRVAKRRAAEA